VTQSRKPKPREIISPAGAGIVIICFFLPWMRVSCGTKKMLLRGSDMGGALYVVLIAAVAMIVAFGIYKFLGQPHKARYIFLGASLLAIGTIVYEYVSVALDPKIPFYIPGKMIGFELKIGAFGTILGLILAGLGWLLLRHPESPKSIAKEKGQ
jgi:hypothetical protein